MDSRWQAHGRLGRCRYGSAPAVPTHAGTGIGGVPIRHGSATGGGVTKACQQCVRGWPSVAVIRLVWLRPAHTCSRPKGGETVWCAFGGESGHARSRQDSTARPLGGRLILTVHVFWRCPLEASCISTLPTCNMSTRLGCLGRPQASLSCRPHGVDRV